VRRFSSLDEFAAAKGQHLGNSEWHEVPQAQINMFADVEVEGQKRPACIADTVLLYVP
jgi:acyl dehydratase